MPQRIDKMEKALKELKSEIQKKANVAHKRLERLERNNLTDLPAYQQWVKDGEVRFGVRGKDYNELQAELARLNRFLDSRTSLVRDANKYLKDVAKMTDVSYKSVKELPEKLSNFFRLTDKIDEYLRNVEGSASAIGYHKIWEVVNEVVEAEQVDLRDADSNLDDIMEKALEALRIEETFDLPESESEFLWNLLK